MRDLSAIEEIQASKLSSSERWSMTLAALDHLDQGISVFDRELRLVGWNKQYLDLLDFPPEFGCLGKPFADFIRYNAYRGEYGPGDPEAQVRERVELAKRFEAHYFERSRPNGTILEIRGNRISGGGFVTVYTDITARNRIEADLQESRTQMALSRVQKMEAIGQLTAGVAHDFNNLLTIIMGNLAFLEEEPRLSKDAMDAVQTTMNAAQRGAELTRRLLAFSRRQTLQPRAVTPARLIAGVRDFLLRTLGPAITIEVVISKDVWNVLADPNELTNAFLNLAINARDAMPERGKLTITAINAVLDQAFIKRHADDIRPGDYVLLTIEDTGVGMSPNALEHAFEPFFTTKAPDAGTGLGLSMVYGFVKQSGGRVQIDSALGKGTCISLYLPRAQQSEPQATASQPDENSRSPSSEAILETILLVEDDPEVRRFISRVLSNLGYSVHTAENGDNALALLERIHKLDLLLTDIVMPGGFSGWELAEKIKRRQPGVKLLCMSGADKINPNALDLRDETLVLLKKPFSKQDLTETVRSTLDQIQPMRRNEA